MSYNFTAREKEEGDLKYHFSWCNNGTYAYSVKDVLDVCQPRHVEARSRTTSLLMTIDTFKEATEKIRAKAADPFGDGSGKCIRPAGGAFGTWYDDEEKLVGPNA